MNITYNNNLDNTINKLKSEFEEKLINNNFTNDQVLIGYDGSSNCLPPLFVHKYIASTRNGNLYQAINERFSGTYYNIHFIIDSLEYLQDIKYIDLYQFSMITIIDKYYNIIRERCPIESIDLINDTRLKNIKKYCDKFNIKIIFNGLEYFNGTLVSDLIDKISFF